MSSRLAIGQHGFMLYTRLLARAPASLVSTYWAGAFVGAALVLGAVALELCGR